MAALFTRTSIPPKRASVSVANRSVSLSRDTSHSTPSACAPRASTSLTVGVGSAMSATTTRAPSAATPRQYSRPMPRAPPVTTTTLSLRRIAPPALHLEGLDVHPRRALRVPHVRPDALSLRRHVALVCPRRVLGDLGILELVEGEIGRRAGPRAEAPAADDAGHLFVVRNVDRVVPGVEICVDFRRDVST